MEGDDWCTLLGVSHINIKFLDWFLLPAHLDPNSCLIFRITKWELHDATTTTYYSTADAAGDTKPHIQIAVEAGIKGFSKHLHCFHWFILVPFLSTLNSLS